MASMFMFRWDTTRMQALTYYTHVYRMSLVISLLQMVLGCKVLTFESARVHTHHENLEHQHLPYIKNMYIKREPV